MAKESDHFSSSEELSAYLSGFRIPLWKWGQGAAKEVSHLLNEINDGDTQLVEEGGGLIRKVCFVNIEITGRISGRLNRLVEDRQVFNEGTQTERVRRRQELGGSVKEKIHPGESPEESASRAIHEELGIESKVDLSKTRSENLDKESPSYPGLRSQYVATYFGVELKGDQVKPEGYKEVESDRTTYFVWQLV